VVDAVRIPVVAAGGIADGRSMAAALALGAEGVQMGSRFVATPEASAHTAFKNEVLAAGEGATQLTLKELAPVRLIKNPFYQQVSEAYARGANVDELRELLGRGRAKKGMREGDLVEGELEIGQVASRIDALRPAADIVRETAEQCLQTFERLC
jgi:enoyl-[acyl-carrier protein] reductase II